MISRKTLAIVTIAVAAVVCIILAVLWQTGFLLTDKSIVPGKGFVPVSQQFLKDYAKQNSTNKGIPNLFLLLMNQTANIPGIDKVSLQIFYSNDSLSSVEDQYSLLMQERDYSPQSKYSGSYSEYGQSISYITFTHGLNGVVIFLTPFLGKTWIAASISSEPAMV